MRLVKGLQLLCHCNHWTLHDIKVQQTSSIILFANFCSHLHSMRHLYSSHNITLIHAYIHDISPLYIIVYGALIDRLIRAHVRHADDLGDDLGKHPGEDSFRRSVYKGASFTRCRRWTKYAPVFRYYMNLAVCNASHCATKLAHRIKTHQNTAAGGYRVELVAKVRPAHNNFRILARGNEGGIQTQP